MLFLEERESKVEEREGRGKGGQRVGEEDEVKNRIRTHLIQHLFNIQHLLSSNSSRY